MFLQEEFENSKGVNRIRKTKDRQHNGQSKKEYNKLSFYVLVQIMNIYNFYFLSFSTIIFNIKEGCSDIARYCVVQRNKLSCWRYANGNDIKKKVWRFCHIEFCFTTLKSWTFLSRHWHHFSLDAISCETSQTLWFRHFTSILEHLSRDFEKTTITAMYHGRWFAYKQTNKYFYCQS